MATTTAPAPVKAADKPAAKSKGFTVNRATPPTLTKRGRKETAANPEIVALLKETLESKKAVGVPAAELRPGSIAGFTDKQVQGYYSAPVRKAAVEAGMGASCQFDPATGLVWFRGLPKRNAVSA